MVRCHGAEFCGGWRLAQDDPGPQFRHTACNDRLFVLLSYTGNSALLSDSVRFGCRSGIT
jgi:hypothetical protein